MAALKMENKTEKDAVEAIQLMGNQTNFTAIPPFYVGMARWTGKM